MAAIILPQPKYQAIYEEVFGILANVVIDFDN
jgi:hypothetical protein